MNLGKLVIKAVLNKKQFEKDLNELKVEHKDDDIELVSDNQTNIFQKVLNFTKKIGHNFVGISASALKFLGTITSLVAKIGLLGGLIGIVAIVALGIASAFSKALEKNEELTTKTKYLKYVLETGFEYIGQKLVKVIEWIVDRLFDLIIIFGTIVKLITGINIFSKATASNFKKANANAQALKKTLAGFDEMNILNDDGGTGVLGGLNTANLRDVASEIDKATNSAKELWNTSFGWFDTDKFKKGFKDLWEEVIKFFKLPTKQEFKDFKEGFKQGFIEIKEWCNEHFFKYFEEAWQGFSERTKGIIDPLVKWFKDEFKPIKEYFDEHIIKPIEEKFASFKRRFLEKYVDTINTIIYYLNKFLGLFGVKIDYIKLESEDAGESIEENIGGAFDETKQKADGFMGPLEDIYNHLKDLTSKKWNISTVFSMAGPNNNTLSSFLQPLRNKLSDLGIKLPYFAKGGVVNMPGRGVPIGYAGERGAEGIIPLTDSQQMQLLGEAIGKFVNINATVPVYVGNRQVAREMKRISAENNFAYNR